MYNDLNSTANFPECLFSTENRLKFLMIENISLIAFDYIVIHKKKSINPQKIIQIFSFIIAQLQASN